jgi:hypothetical protein
MQFKNKILFFCIGTIILIHTFIPHVHHGEIAEKEIVNKNNNNPGLFRILQYVFHISPSTYLKNVEGAQNDVRDLNENLVKYIFAEYTVSNSYVSLNFVDKQEIPHLKAVISIIIQHFKGLRSPPSN